MFATVFLSIIEIDTGKIYCSNAGHNEPIILHSNGSAEFIKSVPGLPLATFKDTKYQTDDYKLEIGDMLILYTDGIVEAFNKNGEAYGNSNLIKFLSKKHNTSAQNLVNDLENNVKQFIGDFYQSDDRTLLTFKFFKKTNIQKNKLSTTFNGTFENNKNKNYNSTKWEGGEAPRKKNKNLENDKLLVENNHSNTIKVNISKKFNISLEELLNAQNFIDIELNNLNISNDTNKKINLALEEIWTNILKFSYDKDHKNKIVEIKIEHSKQVKNLEKNKIIKISVLDFGKKFNPLTELEPKIFNTIKNQEFGGFGILITKKMSKSIKYERLNNQNKLEITFDT
jgi:anti-sigma regulatory factor (Ser/Thr protein kinase)